MNPGQFRWLAFVQLVGFALLFLGAADASTFGPITQALTTANTEARSSIVPAVASILGVLVLITVGAGVVRAVTRST